MVANIINQRLAWKMLTKKTVKRRPFSLGETLLMFSLVSKIKKNIKNILTLCDWDKLCHTLCTPDSSVCNMTVVFNSFDVFELFIFPFD